MSKKITISVPDFLFEQIEKWRKSFNLSKIFQEAVGEAIKRKEGLQARLQTDFSFSEIVKRLKNEKQEYVKEWTERGRSAGFSWAQRAHYIELKNALKETPHTLIRDNTVLTEAFSLFSHTEEAAATEKKDENLMFFAQGFASGIHEFWEIVKKELGQ
ncbi:MAG: hypothetical protein ACLFR1_09595 [Spirochaetia bacterium]